MAMQQELHRLVERIESLNQERGQIYAETGIDEAERRRIEEIDHELQQLWDLRRRMEAADNAGLDHIPVPPSRDAEQQVGGPELHE